MGGCSCSGSLEGVCITCVKKFCILTKHELHASGKMLRLFAFLFLGKLMV